MGYYITLKVKQEDLDDKFKSNSRNDISDSDIEVHKEALIAFVSNLKIESTENFYEYIKLYRILQDAVKTHCFYIQEQWKQNIKTRLETDDEFDGPKDEITFCGWEFSGDVSSTTVEDTINSYVNRLYYIVTIVPHKDYYNELEEFEERSNDIHTTINEYSEMVYDAMTHEFVDMYRDNEIKDESTDDLLVDDLLADSKIYNDNISEDNLLN